MATTIFGLFAGQEVALFIIYAVFLHKEVVI